MSLTRVALSIGSSDSSGGAGIQGDIKAMAAVGCYAATVLVGVTAQNTTGVSGRFTVPVDFVCAQLDAVFSDLSVDAVKIGMTWSTEHIEAVVDRLKGVKVPIVIDPVMVTAAGGQLGGAEVSAAVRKYLLPIADVLTPNLVEARALTGRADGTAQEVAEGLVGLGARSVVVTCGGDAAEDWFADGVGSAPLRRGLHRTGAEHGAGCAHSAIITGLLAQGISVLAAIEEAGDRAGAAVRDGLVHIGSGVHPVNVLGFTLSSNGCRKRRW